MQRSLVLVVSLLASLLLAAPGRAEMPRPLRIWALGDSIIHGICCNLDDPEHTVRGPRGPLNDLLTEAGLPVEWVGTLTDGGLAHDGHDGWTTRDLARITPALAEVYQPDVVLILAGTNDLVAGRSPDEAADGLVGLCGAVWSGAPDALILVAPIPELVTTPWEAYNTLTRTRVGALADAGRPVEWVDVALTTDDLVDGTHPGESGHRRLAEGWAAAIEAHAPILASVASPR